MNTVIDFETHNDLSHMGMTVPVHTRETLENYLIRGWEPGGFVTAMLAMDMERALFSADTANRQMMWAIGRWILEHAPMGSWGNYDLVDAWCKDVDGRRTRYANSVEKQAVWHHLTK